MSDIEKARDMQIMARKDFDALRGMGENPLFAEEIYGFHVPPLDREASKHDAAVLLAHVATFLNPVAG